MDGRRFLIWMSVLLVVAPSSPIRAAEPVLRIDTDMHTGLLREIVTDRASRYLFTGAGDQTIRVWETPGGVPVHTVCFPAEQGSGPVETFAVSADGQSLAVARSAGAVGSAEPQYTIDFVKWRSGQVLRRIRGLIRVTALSFSPDGQHLAVALGWQGIRFFTVKNGEEIARDVEYSGSVVALDFAPDGRLVTSSDDGRLRLYDPGHKLLNKVAVTPGIGLHAVRFSPDGKKLAVGYLNVPRVEVYSGVDLSLLYRPSTTGAENGDLRFVAWSQSGATLAATGAWQRKDGYPIRRWVGAGQGAFTDTPISTQPLTALTWLPQDQLAFATTKPAWGVLAATGRRVLFLARETPTYLPGALSLDQTGSRVRFSFVAPGAQTDTPLRAVFSVVDHILATDSSAEPPRRGEPLLPSALPLPEGTLSSSVSGDGRLLVRAHSDGTIRWYSAQDGRELLALLPHVDRKRWIVWTPSGYYDASVGGEDLLGWQMDRGPDYIADFFRIGLFRKSLYRPDVTTQILLAKDERQAVALADAAAGRPSEEISVKRLLPPVVTILDPSDGERTKSNSLVVRVAVRSPSGEPLASVRAMVQGRLMRLREVRDLVPLRPTQPADPVDPESILYSLPVTIPSEDSTIAVQAETAQSRSKEALLRLRWAGPKVVTAAPLSDLYVLTVGTSKYRLSRLRLGFPAKDAVDLAAALKTQEGKRYRRVEIRVLTDEQATRASILEGLSWLRQKTTPEDTAAFFLAGHGINEASDGKYYYLPYDAELGAAADTMVDAGQIQSFLGSIRGKVLLFLDTCHSGNVLGPQRGQGGLDVNRFVTDMSSVDSGVVVYAASTAGQVSRETERWGNGAFTKALVEGLRGKADYSRTGQVTVSSLELYISTRVKELTFDEQTPTTAKPSTVPDFLIARVPPPLPLYKKAWFWATLSATAAVVAVTSASLTTALHSKLTGIPASDGGTFVVTF